MFKFLVHPRAIVFFLLFGTLFFFPVSAAENFNSAPPFAEGVINPFGLAFDQYGNLFVTNGYSGYGNEQTAIYKISSEGMVTKFHSGLIGATGLAFDTIGNLFVSDDSDQVFKIDPNGNLTVFISNGLTNPNALTIDPDDNVYVLSAAGYLSKFDSDGVFKYSKEGYSSATSIFVDNDGEIIVVNEQGIIFEVDEETGQPTTWLDTNYPNYGGVTRDSAGNFYISSQNVVIKVDPNKTYPSVLMVLWQHVD